MNFFTVEKLGVRSLVLNRMDMMTQQTIGAKGVLIGKTAEEEDEEEGEERETSKRKT